jgi:hypothetical protein
VSAPERLPGRALLRRLLGLLYAADLEGGRSLAREDGGRSPGTVDAGRGMPYERRLTWLSLRLLKGTDSSDPVFEVIDALIADGRLLVRRSVTEDGTDALLPVRGELRGVLLGGSFDLAECTRSSIFCMRLRRLFIWLSDSERAMTVGWKLVRGQTGFVDLASEAATLLPEAREGALMCLDNCLALWNEGRGVAPASGRNDRRFTGAGVFGSSLMMAGASESGGDGGVGASEADSDLGGGVDAVGDVGVTALTSLPGLLVRKLSTARLFGLRDLRDSIVTSARRSFSRRISLSTFRSPSSSLNLCVSILKPSLSRSPILISSSINTPRSMETYSFCSRSSILLVVFRAWRS